MSKLPDVLIKWINRQRNYVKRMPYLLRKENRNLALQNLVVFF